ncbi:MAG TPA: endopeptidase La [Chloroflexota bacterium]|nr:endopeptidase La [Chloroflexota bacterium]
MVEATRPSATAQPTPPGVGGIPEILPVLPLRQAVAFPQAVMPIVVGQERSLRLVDEVMRTNRLLTLVAQRNAAAEPAGPDDLYRIGTVATILQLLRSPDGSLRMAVQGLERVRLQAFTATEPYLMARLEPLSEPGPVEGDDVETEALRRALLDLLRRLVPLIGDIPAEVVPAAEALTNPLQLAYLIASTIPLEPAARQEILELDPLEAKLRRLIALLQHEVAVRELGRQITVETQERLSRAQREHLLREQLKSIQAALGEGEGSPEVAELRQRLEAAGLPEEARREAERELSRLELIPTASPEYGMIRSYLDWMVSLPWNRLTGGEIDVQRARQVLDADHYDLERVKDRILEYLAVRKLRRQRRPSVGLAGTVDQPGEVPGGSETSERPDEPPPGATPQPTTEADEASREPILCFVGPPGVGKTSLGQSIARALGRRFVRMSLGGMRDEAEIRGHRRTYIGALPGRIVQALRRCETRDPVFMLDEIDKVGADWRGDPTSALLEVLDPAQNSTFVDTYLGVPFDLSQVLFIATANTLDTIPAPLRDRMEVLPIAGYTEEEKVHIARQYLIPKQREAHGLAEAELDFAEEAIRLIVRAYTREAGVRDLDRQIATVCRKVAREVAEAVEGSAPVAPVEVTPERLETYLGRRRFFEEAAERTDRPGVATGLAWTPTGGEVLFVEAAMMSDPHVQGQRLLLTGMLGDVMRESAQAALTYVRSDAARLGIDPQVFVDKTVHVHVPAGAMPKDGPSAGVAILAALASLALGRAVRGDVAMTGEITLRGKVLPVGGIKEKVLAAHRAGIKTVILPRRNEPDLDEVPQELRRELEFVLVDTVEQALRRALDLPYPAPATTAAGESAREAGQTPLTPVAALLAEPPVD